jgi:D-alanine-D-alanine ligase
MKSKRVGVLMGGPSSERAISIKSGTAVYSALSRSGIAAIPIELAKAVTMNGYREKVMQLIRLSDIDIAFVALHGTFGEDGKIQEILEDMKMLYTGSRVEASKLGMDKIKSRDIFRLKGIPVPRYAIINKTDPDNAFEGGIYFKELGLPLVIKPSSEGSSIGLSIVDSEKDFYVGIKDAFRYSDRVIIEEYAKGREITVGILADKALPIVEIMPKKRFFDFEAKYNRDLTEYRVPAEINEKEYRHCQDVGLKAHKALGARFFSRVDMILREDGIPVALELNTIPGLTETSLLPKAARAAGIDFEKLILKILESATW